MLVLASASPRRQGLLRNAGIPFAVQPADIDETPLRNESPRTCAERLAREKALTVHKHHPEDFVLGADTIVVIDDMILGKPADAEDAERMLRMLSGRTHTVITGVCLVSPLRARATLDVRPETGNQKPATASEITASETTLVTMCEIPAEEIRASIATGEPMDKAGAYAIQGVASRWIPRIEGDYSNVVGLPVALVYSMLRSVKAI
jgi:septum formation protein